MHACIILDPLSPFLQIKMDDLSCDEAYQELCRHLRFMRVCDLKEFYGMFLEKKSFGCKQEGLDALIRVLDSQRAVVQRVLCTFPLQSHTISQTMQAILREMHACQHCGRERHAILCYMDCIDCFAMCHVADTLDVIDVDARRLSGDKFFFEEHLVEDTCLMFFDITLQPIYGKQLFEENFTYLKIDGLDYVTSDNCTNTKKPFLLAKGTKSIISLKTKKTCFMFRVGVRQKDMFAVMDMVNPVFVEGTSSVASTEDDDVQVMETSVNDRMDIDDSEDDDFITERCPLTACELIRPVKFAGCHAHGYLELEGIIQHFNFCRTSTVKCPMGCNTVYGVKDLHFSPDFVGACQDPHLLNLWEEQAVDRLLKDIAQNGL